MMYNFRDRYRNEMQVRPSNFQDRFNILQAKSLKDSLDKGIYADAL